MTESTQISSEIGANQPDHCCKSTLKERGWTDRAIERFLKQPDKEVPNPYYKSSPPMKLYKLSRVEFIEASDDFKGFQARNQKRLDATRKGMKTKLERLLNTVASMEIFIERKHFEDVILEAIESYNGFKGSMSADKEDFDYQPASIESDQQFLHRITVNYLRHRCTPYERALDKIKGKVGKREAYALLNQMIYNKISELYPLLTHECNSQLEEKIMAGGQKAW